MWFPRYEADRARNEGESEADHHGREAELPDFEPGQEWGSILLRNAGLRPTQGSKGSSKERILWRLRPLSGGVVRRL